MASDSTLPLLAGVGAGAAALYFWQKKQRAGTSAPKQAAPPTTRPPDSWVDPKPVTPPTVTPPVPPMPPPAPKPSDAKPPSKPPVSTPPKPEPPKPEPPKPEPPKPKMQPPITQTAPPPPLRGRWVWPVQIWNGRKPVVSDGWGSPRDGGKRKHEGVDIMFKRDKSDPFKQGTPNGSKWFVMPENTVALAASDGVVWSAGWTQHGFSVVIDHAPQKIVTYYTHLSEMFVSPTQRAKTGQRVYAGQPLGIVGFSPLDGERLKHLHFSVWRGGPADAVDPAPLMTSWEYLNDPRPPSSKPPNTTMKPGQMVARNASLQYRPVGDRGEPYPEWVRALDGKSGVYVIREIKRDGSREVVYVGSSNNRLYDTMTRHFQVWRRYKGYWKGQFAEGHDPGLTYDRGNVEVAVRITSANDALDEEARLIARLRPRDNLLMQPEEEPVPF